MSPVRMSKFETSMRVVLQFNEAFNRHDVTGILTLMSEDCVYEIASPPPDGTTYTGKAAIAGFWQDFFRQTPEAHTQIEEIFNTKERCILRWKSTWVDDNGETLHIRGVDIFRVEGDRIIEQLSYIKG